MIHLHHRPLAVAVALCVTALAPLGAAAQSTTNLDAVEVTGTRIKRAEVEGQVPIQTLTRGDIERTGLTSIGEVLQQLTGSGSALNAKFNSSGNFGFPPDGSGVGAGSAQVDLRHLGAKRVLVLVDGIRWVNESSASGVGSATDLNTIPLAIVERIEVLEDGASSLYGSDAIAGVVNIITRRDFDGAQVTLNYGEYSKGDGTQKGVDLAWGKSGDRFSLFLGASWTKQDPVFAKDREQSRFPIPGTGLAFGSGGIPQGRFMFTDPNTGAVQNIVPNTGVSNPRYDGSAGCSRTDDYHCFTTADRFNFAEYNMVLTPSERKGLFGQFRFDITDNVQWYVKALGNRRESTNQAGPEPLFFGPDGATGNPLADNIVVSRLNPYNPFGFDLVSGDSMSLIGRRPVEGGARVFKQKVDTTYFATGLVGDFHAADRSWYWDVNGMYSKNKAEQTNYGSYDIYKVNMALGDPSVCAATPGCVPLNIFGGVGSITPDMLKWIQPVVRDRSQNELSLFTANLSSELFSLPAGPVSFATGFEYRKYKGSYQPDPLTVIGHYNGVPSQPTSGSYDVNEAYLELSVPIFADSSFGKKLDLSLAGRYSDYSTFGGEFTPKYGLRWQVTDDFVLRTTYAEGFRAPSIGELYGSAARADLQLFDPCSVGLGGTPPRGSAANCAALGVPAGFQQANSQISVTTGGNRELEPERSRSFSAGFVWSPWFGNNASWSERFDVEVTFYRHAIDGAIQAINAQTQLDLCVDTLDPIYCDGITRASTGAVSSFNNRLTNLGSIKTDGWDVDLFWTLPRTSIGQFKLAWKNTFVGRYEATGAAGQKQPQKPGVEVADSSIPEWTSNASIGWTMDRWSANWTVRHISELTENCGDAAAFPVCSNQAAGTNTLSATTFHDMQVGYKIDWMKGLQLTAGLNNVFDKDPPICLSCSLNGYDASTYDIPRGRYWYLRADLRF
ncbi:TonB-dependent receptor plug domain-containing protein [Stenotrophomonas maltophilia]|uniref:TonB-dependent receptor plug domain-containing protein n=1 Tax=Stenotrophomonas maltophilia TaxID=40324 RepID=UPI00066A6579|nr:TonB-dependent receptor [Stenotrophomonas maltophilia]MBH1679716.1 TonB-dependent receptor [Stenotrophomonas maltophilia]MDZ5781256.1 TonB-dependent receptor [Stenotrophomonas maltophilia]NUH62929.1 TonB-dependent receptor [Stenotrophomonas maltophilia]HDS1625299.1 TonB-dependent receptor [Stenotrophomonas maltophilia]HEL3200833.1 TonB-dependent receptor [Stenotrophomonas maltophilia]